MQRNVALVNISTILYKSQIPSTGKIRTVARVKISGRKRQSLDGGVYCKVFRKMTAQEVRKGQTKIPNFCLNMNTNTILGPETKSLDAYGQII